MTQNRKTKRVYILYKYRVVFSSLFDVLFFLSWNQRPCSPAALQPSGTCLQPARSPRPFRPVLPRTEPRRTLKSLNASLEASQGGQRWELPTRDKPPGESVFERKPAVFVSARGELAPITGE